MSFWQTYSGSQLASLGLFAAAAALALWFAVRSVWPVVQAWRKERRSVADTVWLPHQDTANPHKGRRRAMRDSGPSSLGGPSAGRGGKHLTATRVLSEAERQAYVLLCTAMPGRIVLAHVPLARFARLPGAKAQREWLQRVGALQADLLLCDTQSRVLAVVAVRAKHERASQLKRDQRLAHELRLCDIPLHIWHEGAMPTVAGVRSLLAGAVGLRVAPVQTQSLIPVAETRESASEFGFSTFEAEDEHELHQQDQQEGDRSLFEDTVAAPLPAPASAARTFGAGGKLGKERKGERKAGRQRGWAA
jgi:Protein of unknown function (DUF2726)